MSDNMDEPEQHFDDNTYGPCGHIDRGVPCEFCNQPPQPHPPRFLMYKPVIEEYIDVSISVQNDRNARYESEYRVGVLRARVKKLTEILNKVVSASFDHGCGLEGWDGECCECVAARALNDWLDHGA